ncbi:MAG TPA: type II toxin-antitoxin system Phd/YefM family antitoxin [Candidatus Dormibacteraeota bacterium]|jgi:prevent-host-death family protein|nr:type II toxin-antitoxin system Phd/YefM family antitoxin [Candidatus Dormibacteraeota bacterium]
MLRDTKRTSGEVLPLRDVKAHFSALVDQVERTHQRITVTRNGRAAAVLISPDDLESLQETLEVLSSPDLLAQLLESRVEIDGGVAGIPLDQVRSPRLNVAERNNWLANGVSN